MDWRHQSTIDWRPATGHVDRVKIDDGLVLDLRYRDLHDDAHRVQAYVGDANGKWVGASVPIRYDTGDPQSVELVGFGSDDPIPTLLLAGAPLGAGIAGIVLAISLFRRRALVAVSARPLQAMRGPLVAAAILTVAGIAAWAIGTVWQRGWSAVASATGHLAATVFGDLLGVLVPLVAFALGCLVTAWLAAPSPPRRPRRSAVECLPHDRPGRGDGPLARGDAARRRAGGGDPRAVTCRAA